MHAYKKGEVFVKAYIKNKVRKPGIVFYLWNTMLLRD